MKISVDRLKPSKYVMVSVVTAVGGLLNGLDTGCIGPIIEMGPFHTQFGPLLPTTRGFVVSSILLAASVVSVTAGPISDSLGRTKALGLGSAGFAIGAALETAAATLSMFITGRVIVGVGEGLFLSTLVVYICEISPPRHRGALASLVQGFITVGLCAGYFICYGTVRLPSSLSWRFPLGMQALIAVAMSLAAFLYLPDSPRWLSFKGKHEEAAAVWDSLGVSAAEREKDDLENVNTPRRGQQISTHGSFISTFKRQMHSMKNVFTAKNARAQMYLGVFLMSFQQLSGIDGVLYYAPLLFRQAGINSAQSTFLASGISAILIMVATIPAFLLTDKIGRRPSTIYGGAALFICMTIIGSCYAANAVHPTGGAARWVVIILIYIYSVAYCVTWALGIKVFASEIQPVETRAGATSISQSANCITNFFVAFITPVLLAQSSYGAYFLFAGSILLTLVVCVIYMPETKGVDLEQIQSTFRDHRASNSLFVRIWNRVMGVL